MKSLKLAMSRPNHIVWVVAASSIVKVLLLFSCHKCLPLCAWWTHFALKSDVLTQSSVLFRQWRAWSIDFCILPHCWSIWNVKDVVGLSNVSFQWLLVRFHSSKLLWFRSWWSYLSILRHSNISLVRVNLKSLLSLLLNGWFSRWRVFKLFLGAR